MDRAKIKAIAILFFSGYLLASCFTLKVKAEETTTNNILSQNFSTGWAGTATG